MIVIIYSKEYLEEEKRRIEEQNRIWKELPYKHLDMIQAAVREWATEYVEPEDQLNTQTTTSP